MSHIHTKTVLFTVAAILPSAALLWLWVWHSRAVENTSFQMRALARAMAAYIVATDGQFPASLESLESVGAIRKTSPMAIVVTAPESPGFLKLGPPSLTVDVDEFDVPWGEEYTASGRPLLQTKQHRQALHSLEVMLSDQLRLLIERMRAARERDGG